MPYDIGAVTRGGPIPKLRWPIEVHVTKRLQRSSLAYTYALLDQTNGTDRGLILKAAPGIHATILALGTAWMVVAAARRENIEFVASTPTLYAEIEEGRFADLPLQYDDFRARFASQIRRPSKALLRRTAHNLLSNRLAGWLGRRTSVVNHNPLARNESRTAQHRRFAFTTADRLFNGSVRFGEAPGRLHKEIGADWSKGFGKAIESAFPGDNRPPSALIERFAAGTAQWLRDIEAMDAALARDRLANEIWTGTGNNIITRLAQAAVRDAGGDAVGFDHGGGSHHLKELSQFAIGELGCVTRYVTETEARIGMMQAGLAALDAHAWFAPDLRSREGPRGSLRWLSPSPPRRRPVHTVMYVATLFAGEFKHGDAPVPPDPVYADWQARLIDILVDAGYNVLVKGHPEGALRGAPFVMSPRGRFVGGRFDEVIDQADAFLFDYPSTTTLWEAMCTDKHVVLIDFGLADWRSQFRDLFVQRCSVVQGEFDERNLPVVERRDLLDAIEAAPGNDGYAERYLVGTPRTAEAEAAR